MDQVEPPNPRKYVLSRWEIDHAGFNLGIPSDVVIVGGHIYA